GGLHPERARGAVASAARGQGRDAAHHCVQRFGHAAPAGRAARGGALREPGHPGSRAGGGPRAGARVEEVRALLDLESSRRRGRRASDPLRTLHAGRSGPPAVTAPPPPPLAVLVLDQVTKYWALQRLLPGIPRPVLDSFFSLTLVMNPGLAFG